MININTLYKTGQLDSFNTLMKAESANKHSVYKARYLCFAQLIHKCNYAVKAGYRTAYNHARVKYTAQLKSSECSLNGASLLPLTQQGLLGNTEAAKAPGIPAPVSCDSGSSMPEIKEPEEATGVTGPSLSSDDLKRITETYRETAKRVGLLDRALKAAQLEIEKKIQGYKPQIVSRLLPLAQSLAGDRDPEQLKNKRIKYNKILRFLEKNPYTINQKDLQLLNKTNMISQEQMELLLADFTIIESKEKELKAVVGEVNSQLGQMRDLRSQGYQFNVSLSTVK
jgi:hypothetical protein